VVEVSDEGSGVPEGIRKQIFEPFFTTKSKGKGTGLGLSISSKIVQEHGGRIEIHDNSTGGSIFRVIFPRTSG
ncbi:MAG: HAMP domain-containing sensor histidine kinase, partial [Myxococcota bacterium]|nr:HAMP domain-containing sensor histidine kinase [Myxococcota bacterium]